LESAAQPILLGVTGALMFGLGTRLSVDDLRRVVTRPKAAAVGLFNQLVLLPLAGLAVATGWGLPPALAVGIVVITACPGGLLSNLLTWLGRGDAALSVGLTAVSTCASLLTLPLWLSLAALTDPGMVRLSPAEIVGQVALLTVLPVGLGVAAAGRWPDACARAERPLRAASLLFIALAVIGVIAARRDEIAADMLLVGGPLLALHLGALMMGFVTAKLAGLSRPQIIAVTLETGIQNFPLGAAVAAGLLGHPEAVIPVAVYGILMFKTAGIVAAVGRRMALAEAS
jgi:BASS family bile acid:Na+ symporter